MRLFSPRHDDGRVGRWTLEIWLLIRLVSLLRWVISVRTRCPAKTRNRCVCLNIHRRPFRVEWGECYDLFFHMLKCERAGLYFMWDSVPYFVTQSLAWRVICRQQPKSRHSINLGAQPCLPEILCLNFGEARQAATKIVSTDQPPSSEVVSSSSLEKKGGLVCIVCIVVYKVWCCIP